MSPMLINFIAFQIGWFACVLGGAHQLPWFGTLLVGIIIAIHLSRASQPRAELFLILIAILKKEGEIVRNCNFLRFHFRISIE